MINKQLKAGQIFTMYGLVWRVNRCPVLPCSFCMINAFRWNSDDNPLQKPCKILCECKILCGGKEKIPSDCNVTLVKQKRK